MLLCPLQSFFLYNWREKLLFMGLLAIIPVLINLHQRVAECTLTPAPIIHEYELMLSLLVFRQTGPPQRVDCLAPPSVCHIETEASR